MTIDELKAAIERRGYTVSIHPIGPHSDGRLLVVYRGGVAIVSQSISLFELDSALISVGGYIEECLLCGAIDGQHHMQHECGYPLLRETKNSGNHETLAYRSASAGPRSKSLLECPKCLQYVQDDSVEEIDDATHD